MIRQKAWKQTFVFAKWGHSVKWVTTLLDQSNIALKPSGIVSHHIASHSPFISIHCCAHFCVGSKLGCVRLYNFINLPNYRIAVLAKIPGFCPCVVSTWPLISEYALIQMNGAFQINYCMGPNSAIFHQRIFGWAGIYTWDSQLRSRALFITTLAHTLKMT